MSVLRTLVSSSRALVTGAKDVARFRQITTVFVKHGFGWVVSQLKLRRELQVDHEGAALTRAALVSPESGRRLVAAFTELGPTFIKLGQILSTRPDLLPAPLIEELTVLQDGVEPLPFEQLHDQLQRALGPDYRARFKELDETPLASASIAQVHRATLEDGDEVVLKIQRPGLRRKIVSDLNILRAISGYLEDAFPEAHAMDLRGTIDGFAKSLSQEIDFRVEARNMERFRRNFQDEPQVRIPRVYSELSNADVLCMALVKGRKFSELLESGEDPGPVVDLYFHTAFKMLFIHGFFHGDLHPGNVFVEDDGGLAIIDCGMVGRLSRPMKDKLIDVLYAVLNEDLEGVARTFYALAIKRGKVDYNAFEADVIEIGDRFLGGVPLAELQIGELFSELVEGATRHNVRMPTDFTMMFKAIVTTEGLARSIAPDIDPVAKARPFITEMMAERYSPERIKQLAISDLLMLSSVLRTVPQQITGVLSDLRNGTLALAVSPETLTSLQRTRDLRQRRVVRAALAMTCLVCGTYTLGLGLPGFAGLGLPFASTVFYASALLLLLWRR